MRADPNPLDTAGNFTCYRPVMLSDADRKNPLSSLKFLVVQRRMRRVLPPKAGRSCGPRAGPRVGASRNNARTVSSLSSSRFVFGPITESACSTFRLGLLKENKTQVPVPNACQLDSRQQGDVRVVEQIDSPLLLSPCCAMCQLVRPDNKISPQYRKPISFNRTPFNQAFS